MSELDLPTIEEEVTRKALAEVKRLLEDYSFKRISKRELELCLASVWNCVAGCTLEDFHQVSAAASAHIKTLPDDPARMTLFRNLAGKLVILRTEPGRREVEMFMLGDKGWAYKAYSTDMEERPEQAAALKRDELREVLSASGYQELGSIR